MTITFSPQQTAFINWCKTGHGSVVLEAVAGAGKTTTILEGLRYLRGQTAVCAFNKSIADEIKAKLQKMGIDWKQAQGGTVHSFGFAAYRKFQPNVKVDGNKCDKLLNTMGLSDHMKGCAAMVAKLVSMAKQAGYGVVVNGSINQFWSEIDGHFEIVQTEFDHLRDEIFDLATELLDRSNKTLDVIDYDDMIYLPLKLRLKIWQFDNVIVDEAQDTNAIRRAFARAMLRKGGRMVAVGDRHQAIYAFTGADAKSLDFIADDFNCARMPLTVSYRCPKSVVAFAQQWVSHIEAHPDAIEGEVLQQSFEDIETALKAKQSVFAATDAILCRNTKPLITLAFKLIRHGVGAKVAGRDIGSGLVKFVNRWSVKTIEGLLDKLEAHLEAQRVKLTAAKKEMQLAGLEDQIETIRVIAEKCLADGQSQKSAIVDQINALFEDDTKGVLTLSTIHKAKGREWQKVWWLDRAGTCPSRWARQAWQQEQEVNLMYVAATRAQQTLVEIAV